MAELSPGHLQGATVAVTGASGNVGTALLRLLTAPGSGVAEVRGLARRTPPAVAPYDSVRWFSADLGDAGSDDVLTEFVDGADVVVHLAWALQPGRQPDRLHRVNVDGSWRVARAAAAAGVPHVLHMSSIGAYAAGAVGRQVGEDWPTTGIPSAQYSRDKVEAERVVRQVLAHRTSTVLSIARPTLVLQPEAGSEIGRYFLGPLLFAAARHVPGALARLLPLPLPDLALSFVHADDVADALVRIVDRRAPGPFNIAADPLLDAAGIAEALGSRRVPVPAMAVRVPLQVAFAAHLVPTEPGWLDLGTSLPAMDTTRARTQLGWAPAHRSDDVLRSFVAALAAGTGGPGALLRPANGPELDPAGAPGPG
ncbi:NAD-dependent epimerase/dehydratase family protein [Blastococcus sp. TML/M2B]|uniref:NAD-dependent epimerase/dehydratase family protein n=1 Tax=unclassified Blastococcus TaxID=2619396 RepID=UPI00190D6383|nr:MULTISPECIES: NAD-dependent epimerase/dehydratase family protein [unclassified Blastococcus]MBN1091934.1 NAD-dependent epimerase/dehydratase family protein [Blastococcus sp. TML/M2B]MBN1097964.1 NAD-dependent epimerase/dehydratase family protein [Blastococcus sp. TML/C7B]